MYRQAPSAVFRSFAGSRQEASVKDNGFSLISGGDRRTEPRDDVLHAIRRVRTIVLASAEDCRCRDRVADAIQSFEHLEHRREKKRLADATRTQRRKIKALLELLEDLDPATADDGELSEASLLLNDIAAEAALASSHLRELLRLRAAEDGN
jgi:hypothetical protein